MKKRKESFVIRKEEKGKRKREIAIYLTHFFNC